MLLEVKKEMGYFLKNQNLSSAAEIFFDNIVCAFIQKIFSC